MFVQIVEGEKEVSEVPLNNSKLANGMARHGGLGSPGSPVGLVGPGLGGWGGSMNHQLGEGRKGWSSHPILNSQE